MRTGLLALALLPGAAQGYGDSPPAGHSGGFGEPDCTACHFAPGPDAPAARLWLEGVPRHYRPGRTYRLILTLEGPGMAAGGVTVAARHPDGGQAGNWQAGDGLEVARLAGIQYLRHAQPLRGAPARWKAQWTAPEACGGPVLFHAAGNVGNADDSPFGDRVVTLEKEILPLEPCAN